MPFHTNCCVLLILIVCEKLKYKKICTPEQEVVGGIMRSDSVSASSLFQRGRTCAYFGPSLLAAVKHLVSMFMLE